MSSSKMPKLEVLRGKSAHPVKYPCYQKASIYLLAVNNGVIHFNSMFVVGELGLSFSSGLAVLAF